MSRIFITGSADGLGQLAAKSLIEKGHKVVLHGRNSTSGSEAIKKNPGAEGFLVGDLSNIEETKNLAHEANKTGLFDVVIHNAGVYRALAKDIFYVNTLAPYILTSLIQKPKRLIYLSSGMHMEGHFNPDYFNNNLVRITYSDSKLHILMLCFAFARRWPDVYANAVNPGWVPTRMGGVGAPDSLQKGYETQVWLAESNDKSALVSGRYFFHQKEKPHNPDADDVNLQERYLEVCAEVTGVKFPLS